MASPKTYFLIKKNKGDGCSIEFVIFEKKDKAVANLTCFIHENVAEITHINSTAPGLKLGTFLMHILSNQLGRQTTWVQLDDCTGVNPPENLYYKLGFRVKDQKTNCFISWKTWQRKYCKVFSNPSEERIIHRKNLFLNSFLLMTKSTFPAVIFQEEQNADRIG